MAQEELKPRCLIPNCRRAAPVDGPFCSKHRDKSEMPTMFSAFRTTESGPNITNGGNPRKTAVFDPIGAGVLPIWADFVPSAFTVAGTPRTREPITRELYRGLVRVPVAEVC